MNKREKYIRTALKANAIFSFLSGFCLIFFHQQLAEIMHISKSSILMWIGIALWVFVASLLYNAYKKELNQKEIKMIIYQDWAWVAGSAIIIIGSIFSLSTAGYILIGVVAVIVGVLAILQKKGLEEL